MMKNVAALLGVCSALGVAIGSAAHWYRAYKSEHEYQRGWRERVERDRDDANRKVALVRELAAAADAQGERLTAAMLYADVGAPPAEESDDD